MTKEMWSEEDEQNYRMGNMHGEVRQRVNNNEHDVWGFTPEEQKDMPYMGSERAREIINSPDFQDITDLIKANIPIEEWPDECFIQGNFGVAG